MYCVVSSSRGSLVRIPDETHSSGHLELVFIFLCIRKLYIFNKYIYYFVICFITKILIKQIIIGIMTSCFLFKILYELYCWTCHLRVSFVCINTICDLISAMVKHMLTPRKYRYYTHNSLSWTYDVNFCVSKTTNQIITKLTWILGMYCDTIK